MLLLWLLRAGRTDAGLRGLCSEACPVCCTFDPDSSRTFCTENILQCPTIPESSYSNLYIFLGAWVGAAILLYLCARALIVCCFTGCCGARGLLLWALARRRNVVRAQPLPPSSELDFAWHKRSLED
jgi:hypothetical protein